MKKKSQMRTKHKLRDAEQERANQRLLASGLFSHLGEANGIYGYIPVQMLAALRTGEAVYFRARGTKASLEISIGDSPTLTFEHEFEGSDPMYASWLSGGKCIELILKWSQCYLSGSLPAGQRSGQTTIFRSKEVQSADDHVSPFAAQQ